MKKTVCEVAKLTGITVVVYLTMRYVLPLGIPFFCALLIAKWLYPVTKNITGRVKIKKGIITAVLLLLFFAVAGVSLFFLGRQLAEQISNLTRQFPIYQQKILIFWENCCMRIEEMTGLDAQQLNGQMQENLPMMWQEIKGKAVSFVMTSSWGWIKRLAAIVTFVMVLIVATFFMVNEYEQIKRPFLENHLGQVILRVLRGVYQAGGGYLKTQLKIMLIIMGICTISLFLAGNEYALLLGILIGICDALPFLGTGTVFLPWALLSLVQRDYKEAIIYVGIYAICSVTREVVEPKLLGDKMGIPPLVVLISIYVGLKVYGIAGVFLGPLSYIFIKEIKNAT